jgi:hypothetical protein
MPADIRSFFGGKGATSTPIREKASPVKKEDDSKKKRSSQSPFLVLAIVCTDAVSKAAKSSRIAMTMSQCLRRSWKPS